MFQPTFDTSTEDQLGCDEFGYGDILVTMDGAPQQAKEVGASKLHTATTGFDSAITIDTGRRRSDTGRQSDTRCCRLVAGVHGDTVSRPARIAGGQGT
jgi:hypothetical protein